ncbi:unnamed protein product [Brachionus calyciflorus]|uniref:Uncharacterized protein n=1 Tax=Brachionus calyciflorus TaxID=104777 RepID=A0A814C3S8_9BILA|nr:unnamed protein product [Brachionus calyciflorus]
MIDSLEEQEEIIENQEFINRKWFMYDSKNKRENSSAIKPILKLLYPEDLTHVVSMVEVIPQKSLNPKLILYLNIFSSFYWIGHIMIGFLMIIVPKHSLKSKSS